MAGETLRGTAIEERMQLRIREAARSAGPPCSENLVVGTESKGAFGSNQCRNRASVRSIGRAPSNGKIGVRARNRINSSGDSGSERLASVYFAIKP